MQQDALPPLHSLPFYTYTMQCVIKMPDIYCRILSRRCCHLQLNRGAAHLEINFAVNSRSRVPVLQLSRGAMTSHFCHWARSFNPHVGAYRQARSPSYMARSLRSASKLAANTRPTEFRVCTARSPSYNGSFGGLEPAPAHALFRKALLHLNRGAIEPIFAALLIPEGPDSVRVTFSRRSPQKRALEHFTATCNYQLSHLLYEPS